MLTAQASGFWLLYWIPKSAAWLPRQLILFFPGAVNFPADGIFINNRSRGNALPSHTIWEKPQLSFSQYLPSTCYRPHIVLDPEVQRSVWLCSCSGTEIAIQSLFRHSPRTHIWEVTSTHIAFIPPVCYPYRPIGQ
jgi:hypothetical protein